MGISATATCIGRDLINGAIEYFDPTTFGERFAGLCENGGGIVETTLRPHW
jgi:hypothetical protein